MTPTYNHRLERSYRPGTLVAHRPSWGPHTDLYVIVGWRWRNSFISQEDITPAIQSDCVLVKLPFGPGPMSLTRWEELEQITILTNV